jgi:hypothetical protein
MFPALATLAILLPSGIQAGMLSGTVTLSNQSYDFATQEFGPSDQPETGGDLYYLSEDCPVEVCGTGSQNQFWANNTGQQGLQDIGPVPLQSITSIPGSGYEQFGVLAVLDDSYISLAESSEPGEYIFFQVTDITESSVTLDWIYGSEAPGTVPEPASFLLSIAAVSGLVVALRRRNRLQAKAVSVR